MDDAVYAGLVDHAMACNYTKKARRNTQRKQYATTYTHRSGSETMVQATTATDINCLAQSQRIASLSTRFY
jgi:predicted ATPase